MTGVFAAIFDEHGRICCIHQNYGAGNWGLPGGGIERGESPTEALEREVREETGYIIRVRQLVGVFSTPAIDSLALCFQTEVVEAGAWQATDEIAERGFFRRDELPQPMNPRMRRGILDAFDGRRGIVRVFR